MHKAFPLLMRVLLPLAIVALPLRAVAGPHAPDATQTADRVRTAGPVTAADTPIVDAGMVTVRGQFTGPGLWKVSKGSNALWVFATVAPVPRGLEWYSHQAETVLGRAQEVIWPPGVSASLGVGGMFRMAFAMPTMMRSRNLPDGKTLRDVLPADLYARWMALSQQYRFDEGDVERMRPVFAASYLYAAALRRAGLDGKSGVADRVGDLAKRHRIKVTTTMVARQIKDPKGLARSFAGEQIDDVPCFRGMLSLLESDVGLGGQGAMAWGWGDVDTLLRLAKRPPVNSCMDVTLDTEAARRLGMDAAIRQSRRDWVAAAERALATQHTTFAVLPLGEVVDEDGLLAQLRGKGYAVEPPPSSTPPDGETASSPDPVAAR